MNLTEYIESKREEHLSDFWPEPNPLPDEQQSLAQLQQLPAVIRAGLDEFKKFSLPRFFRFFPVWLLTILLLLAIGIVCAMSPHPALNAGFLAMPVAVFAVLWLAMLAVHFYGRFQAGPVAKKIARDLATARRLHDASLEKAEQRCRQEQERIQKESEDNTRRLNQQWKQTVKEAVGTRGQRAMAADEKTSRALKKNEQVSRAKLSQLDRDHAADIAHLREEAEARTNQLAAVHKTRLAKLNDEQQTRWQALADEWKTCIQPVHDTIRAANAAAGELFPGWQQPVWKQWTLPEVFKNAAKFGRIEVDADKLAEAAPRDQRLALPFPVRFFLPLTLKYPGQGSVLFETAKNGGDEAIAAINNIIFRLLSTHPAGKLNFTIFDPVGLGQNFAGLMQRLSAFFRVKKFLLIAYS
ncbi:MAG: hypothetical protein LAN18_12520 [Acidobacteriia bacterium]|nr:hypothetical protein [Terriglobia bacterium]